MKVKLEFSRKDYTQAKRFIHFLGFDFKTQECCSHTRYAKTHWIGPNITGEWNRDNGKVWLDIPDNQIRIKRRWCG